MLNLKKNSLSIGYIDGDYSKNDASSDVNAPIVISKESPAALLRKLSGQIVCEIPPSVSIFGEVRAFFGFFCFLFFINTASNLYSPTGSNKCEFRFVDVLCDFTILVQYICIMRF